MTTPPTTGWHRYTFAARQVLQWGVGVIVLVALTRTWVAIGLVEPVYVAGNSMAPHFLGAHRTAFCAACAAQVAIEIAAPERLEDATPHCPLCDRPIRSWQLTGGDALLVWRQGTLQRWQPVIYRDPTAGGKLVLKRLVGLPGEIISIENGDIYPGDAPARKSLAQQHQTRILLHREAQGNRRWEPGGNSHWQFRDRRWEVTASTQDRVHWLHYRHPDEAPIIDALTFNSALTRKLFPVRDFLLELVVEVSAEAKLELQLRDGRGEYLESAPLTVGTRRVEFSNFDRQLTLALDSAVLAQRAIEDGPTAGTASPFSVGISGGPAAIAELALYRDIHYLTARQAGGYVDSEPPIQLGEGEFFLLGDNVPVSSDSRQSGPVRREWILGTPSTSR